MEGSEKEKSSDMGTPSSLKLELDRGGDTCNVFPPLPSPLVSDQVEGGPASTLMSSATPHRSDEEHLSQRNLLPTDLARTSCPAERSSFPQRTEGGPDDMHMANMETLACSRDELDRGGGSTHVVPPLNSSPRLILRGASTGPPSVDTQKRGGEQLFQSSLSTIDQATATSLKRSTSVLHTGAEAIQQETEAGDARYEALVRERITAIKRKDCKALLLIVKELDQTKLFWEKIPDMFEISSETNSRTILHVAAMQGCFPLAKQVLDIVVRVFAHAEAEKYIDRVDPESDLTAFQMAFDITGNRSIVEYIKHVRPNSQDLKQPFLEANDPDRTEQISTQPYPFYDAYTRNEWWEFLLKFCEHGTVRFDPELRYNSRRLLETFHGLTALHLAILLKDVSVVREIMNIFSSAKKVVWGDSYYPSALTWEQMMMLPGEGWVNNMRKELSVSSAPFRVRDLLRSILKAASVLQSDATALDLAKELGHSEILKELQDYGNNGQLEEEVWTTMLPEFYYDMQSPLLTTIEDVMQPKDEWRQEFEEDVDFNFEERPRLCFLQLHYLCKDPVKFQQSILLPLCYSNLERGSNYGLLSIFDGQGRSALRILLDSWPKQHQLKPDTFKKVNLMLPNIGSFKKMFDFDIYRESFILDVKGRQLQHIFFLNHYFDDDCNALRSWKDIPYPMLLKHFQLALSMKESKLALSIWMALRKRFYKIDGQRETTLCHPLLIAASYGNQTILRLELDGTFDPLVTDDKRRTALHHAADASLLDPPYTDEEFYSTVEEVCRDKKMWKEERGKVCGFYDGNSSNDMLVYDQNEIFDVVERKACILMLVQAGVDLSEPDNEGKLPNVGASVDANLQSWWYDMVVTDATDHKNSFNQAGNALSVVGTLVAATSYVGPLQPPMNYIEGGFVHIGEKLVEIFMVTNTLAFYFAMASVMFAVVPSLPMPREGVMSELKRARHTVSLSLCFLLIATSMIIVSFGAASIAVIHDEQSFHRTDLLFVPSLIGWSTCLFATLGFLLRVMTLILYKNLTIRKLYQFSLSEFYKKAWRSWKYYFTNFDSFVEEWKYFEKLLVHGADYLNSLLRDEPDSRFLTFIVFVIRAVVGVVVVFVISLWLVCWPILHYVYTFRNLERLEKEYKDEKAKLHGDRKRRSFV